MDLDDSRKPFTGRLIFLIVCAVMLSARLIYVYLSDVSQFPIKTVKVSAPFNHVSREQLELVLSDFGYASFFSYPTNRVKNKIEQIDWVKSANVERIWPDTLKIVIYEKEPIAKWNDYVLTKGGDLLNTSNVLDTESLSVLKGPDEQRQDVLQCFKKLSKLLDKNGLRIATLGLSDNQAWDMTLTNGLVLHLGRKDVEKRLERFCKAYSAIFLGKQDQMSSVDLRYARGMAVQWKEQMGK